jgi:hypothetical protein
MLVNKLARKSLEITTVPVSKGPAVTNIGARHAWWLFMLDELSDSDTSQLTMSCLKNDHAVAAWAFLKQLMDGYASVWAH